ncbi:hypothetical protein DFJ67_3457 [Asanoa ferruginea]|uniref:BMP family ABC transporter substrate-binding protein n=1 Tax=Asanoa ferruginea TaxID=53367 RepID=A0A3D9ZKS7_9ACTN|nr:hypothetical protein [Asanoa ferruginea]REF97459.1 hypothetical protein DFJ67_3457 [Asanoa ferruginea]
MLRAAATLAVAAAFATGCASGTGADWSQPRPIPSPVGTLGPGFVDPTSAPTPEATITPEPGSWNGIHPAKGYRVVLLTAGDDGPTKALVTAIEGWAEDEHVDLRTVRAGSDVVPSITKAIDMGPDLIVTAGNNLIDPLALVTASHLAQKFLVVGAEVAEPTHNVTAVDWSGASFRGEGLGASSTYDATSFTPERCAAAIRAGAAAVLTNLTGIVIWLDRL